MTADPDRPDTGQRRAAFVEVARALGLLDDDLQHLTYLGPGHELEPQALERLRRTLHYVETLAEAPAQGSDFQQYLLRKARLPALDILNRAARAAHARADQP